MTPAIIQTCKELMGQYNSEKEETKKQDHRNKLFLQLKPYMIKWMSSIMAEKKIYFINRDLLSLSWDCFEFCLLRYNAARDIPIPNHFYAYSKFFLIMYVAKESKELNKTHEQFAGSEANETEEWKALLHIEELKSFYNSLEGKYKLIFEDALMSMSINKKDRVRRVGESSYKYAQYVESKKVFKIIVDFLLRR